MATQQGWHHDDAIMRSALLPKNGEPEERSPSGRRRASPQRSGPLPRCGEGQRTGTGTYALLPWDRQGRDAHTAQGPAAIPVVMTTTRQNFLE